MRTYCDKGCKTEFEVSPDLFKKNSVYLNKEECIVTFFLCPLCGIKYVVSTENAEIRNLLNEIKKLNQKLSRKPTTQKELKQHDKFVRNKDKVKKKIADRQCELNRLVYPLI